MANILNVHWRQNHSKKFVIWCIVFKLVITFPYVFSECLGINIGFSLFPQGDVNIKYGSPLELLCVVDNSYITAEDLEFSTGSKVIESNVVNVTTRRLLIEKPEKQSATYYCKNKMTGKICPTRVLVESPPSNVTDFGCVSEDLNVLNCSWSSSPDAFSKINYELFLKFNGIKMATSGQLERINDIWYVLYNATSRPRYRQQQEFFNFVLKSCNRFGCNEQDFLVDHFAVVKPAQPRILGLNILPCSIILKWNVSFNMVDLLSCGLDHKIEYNIAEIDNATTFHPVDTSKLAVNRRDYSLELELPYANQRYEVRIYIKPKKASDEYWSDFSYIVFSTTNDIPKMPPGMIVGSFYQVLYENKRVIYVYWKQDEEYVKNGHNYSNRVLVTQNNKKTIFLEEKNYLELDDASLEAVSVEVWASNVVGLSQNSSFLYIPPARDIRGLQLKSFTQIANNNGIYELFWNRFENIDNYSLFWCEHHHPKVCSGRMDYIYLDADKSNHTINLPTGLRYQFALSVNNGTTTSGMIWATCDIIKEDIELYDFPVHLHNDFPGKSFVGLKWSCACAGNEKIIKGYKINYCPVSQTSTLCDTAAEQISVYISDHKQLSVNITDLQPSTTYKFTISIKTANGFRVIEKTERLVTTLEDCDLMSLMN